MDGNDKSYVQVTKGFKQIESVYCMCTFGKDRGFFSTKGILNTEGQDLTLKYQVFKYLTMLSIIKK